MGGIYVSQKVGVAPGGDVSQRVVSVAELTPAQYNGAMVDENGGAISFITATGLDLAGSSPVSHPINFQGLTLPPNSNVIRGASVNPTRMSGWTSFSGTVSTAPNPVYMDYRELHSTGAAEVLGVGLFPFMDSGASGKSMYALQAIAEADAGATVAAATGVGDGVFPIWAKCLINGAGFNASAVAAVAFLSFQENDVPGGIAGADTSMINMEIASGGIRSVFKVQDSAVGGATYLFDFTDDLGKPCSLTNGTVLNDIKDAANQGWIRVRIGSTDRYIPLYALKA
jgi:hypothetical protein